MWFMRTKIMKGFEAKLLQGSQSPNTTNITTETHVVVKDICVEQRTSLLWLISKLRVALLRRQPKEINWNTWWCIIPTQCLNRLTRQVRNDSHWERHDCTGFMGLHEQVSDTRYPTVTASTLEAYKWRVLLTIYWSTLGYCHFCCQMPSLGPVAQMQTLKMPTIIARIWGCKPL